MAIIRLSTFINAPVQRCFDLARSIDLHLLSTEGTEERAIAGKVSGLINQGEHVSWEAVHFGIRQKLETRITHMERPRYFRDEMVSGAFKSMHHEHHFEEKDNGTLMTDVFCYETPFAFIGKLFDAIVLERHMRYFLVKRNTAIKTAAEGTTWHDILTTTL